MKKSIFSLLVTLALTCGVAMAADIDGKWTSEAPAGGKGGPQTLTLKSAGAAVTGSIEGGRGGAVEISDGKIDGAKVSFKVVREFNGNKISQEYTGTVSATELKVNVTGGRGGPVDMVFKK